MGICLSASSYESKFPWLHIKSSSGHCWVHVCVRACGDQPLIKRIITGQRCWLSDWRCRLHFLLVLFPGEQWESLSRLLTGNLYPGHWCLCGLWCVSLSVWLSGITLVMVVVICLCPFSTIRGFSKQVYLLFLRAFWGFSPFDLTEKSLDRH